MCRSKTVHRMGTRDGCWETIGDIIPYKVQIVARGPSASLQDSLLRLFLVKAVQAQQMERVTAFFAAHGESLVRGPQSAAWARWFALPFMQQPEKDPDLRVGAHQLPRPAIHHRV